MLTHDSSSTSPYILSIEVQPPPGQAVLVITTSPIMARAVGDFLRQLDGALKPIWLTSVKKACARLEWDQPKMVILDAADTADTTEAAEALHQVAPKMELLFLGGTANKP